MVVTNYCKWLHCKLEELPFFRYPFRLDELPLNGIYFFYEDGEEWGHDGNHPRIVRIGTHKGNNFRSRINDHYLFDDRKMNFNQMKSAPKDRSIFRKNIGRAMLTRENDEYLKIWNIDFTSRDKREQFGHMRDIQKEKKIESRITQKLRGDFAFRFLIMGNQSDRIGLQGLESSLIGTLAKCDLCCPSKNWLGNYSSIQKINNSGLWLVQHLNSDAINEKDIVAILNAIEETKEWIGGKENGMERNI